MNNTPNFTNKKVAVIGAGYVGSSITFALSIKGLAREIVLIELEEAAEKCLAEKNDIRHGIPSMGSSNIYCGNYSDIQDCDLIIIAAGRNRKPGETRLELTADNINTISQIAVEIKKYYQNGVILVVTNPIDVLTHVLTEWLDLPDGIVFGTGCILDTSRLVNVIGDYIGAGIDLIDAHVIGEHGDGQIVFWSKAIVAGVPIEKYCEMNAIPFTAEVKSMIENKVRTMGAEIIKGKGRTHYGIATCVCYIADAILNDRSTTISVSSVLKGEYGINNLALSIPSIIGARGVEQRLTEKLEDNELLCLKEAAKTISSYLPDSI